MRGIEPEERAHLLPSQDNECRAEENQQNGVQPFDARVCVVLVASDWGVGIADRKQIRLYRRGAGRQAKGRLENKCGAGCQPAVDWQSAVRAFRYDSPGGLIIRRRLPACPTGYQPAPQRSGAATIWEARLTAPGRLQIGRRLQTCPTCESSWFAKILLCCSTGVSYAFAAARATGTRLYPAADF